MGRHTDPNEKNKGKYVVVGLAALLLAGGVYFGATKQSLLEKVNHRQKRNLPQAAQKSQQRNQQKRVPRRKKKRKKQRNLQRKKLRPQIQVKNRQALRKNQLQRLKRRPLLN